MKRNLFVLFLSIVMIFTFTSVTFAADKNAEEKGNKEIVLKKERIHKILEEMDTYRANKLLEQAKQNTNDVLKLDSYETDLEKELESLGVKKLSIEEVKARYSDPNTVTAQITAPPSTSAINWYVLSYSSTRNGVSYDLQDLYAQGLNGDSNLAVGADGAAVYTNKQIAVSTLTQIASMYAQKAIGLIPVVAWLPYEFLFSNNTNVTNNSYLVTHRSLSTVCFTYVKKTGQSDSYQSLTFVSNKFTVASSHTLAGYNNGAPYSKTTDKTNTVYADDYAPIAKAIDAFVDPAYSQSLSFADSYKFYNHDKTASLTYYVITPFFPAQVF